MDIFQFDDYRSYIQAQIERNGGVRGYKSQLAEACQYHLPYFSKMLAGLAELAADRAMGLCDFWGMDDEASSYFVDLVLAERAASAKIKGFINRRLQRAKKRHASSKTPFKEKQLDKREHELLYYSAWYWSAIHILAGIPGFNSPEKVARHLNLPAKLVSDCFLELESMGILARKGGGWVVKESSIHLPKTSPLHSVHHLQWRHRALEALQQKSSSETLHYTSVFSISKNDVPKLRSLLVEFLDASRELVKNSGKEEVMSLQSDLFFL
jgi:uncharacterized protein (TIGR02147 family)